MAKKAKKKAKKATRAPKKASKKATRRVATKAAKKAPRRPKAVARAKAPAKPPPAPGPARPLRPTAKSYRSLVVARLAQLRLALIEDLQQRVFVYPFPEGTKSLDYEIHFQTLSGAMPLTGYLMDGHRGQVMLPGTGGEPVLARNIDVLPSVRPVIPWSMIEPFDDAAVEMLDIHAELLRGWFLEAWTAAGGKQRFRLPASISFHDDDEPTPLPNAAE